MPVKLPNILLILNDDMGYSDIGCYGGEVQPFFGMFSSASSYFTPRTLSQQNDPTEAPREGFYMTDETSDHAAEFIRYHGSRHVAEPYLLSTACRAFYDIVDNRTETSNLADSKPDMVAEIADRWQDWARRCDVVPWDEANPNMRPK